MTKSSNDILIFIILVICANSFSPLIDLYSPWYIVMGLAIIMLMYLNRGRHNELYRGMKVLFGASVLVLFQYWLTHRTASPINYIVNGIIVWMPCVLALLFDSIVNKKSVMMLLQASLIIMSITALTSIHGLIQFPNASRELATSNLGEVRILYSLMNIGGFDFIYALVISIPLVAWMIKHTHRLFKFINIVILLVFLFCIYKSSYTTALIFTIVGVLMLLLTLKPNSKIPIVLLISLCIILYFTGIISDFFLWISTVVENNYVSDRLLQLSMLFGGTEASAISTTTTTDRIELTQMAIDGFCKSPLLGHNFIYYDTSYLSGHSYILDILSASGLIGLGMSFIIFYKIFKVVFRQSFINVSVYVKIVWFLFIAISFVNPTNFSSIYFIIFPLAKIINNYECTLPS